MYNNESPRTTFADSLSGFVLWSVLTPKSAVRMENHFVGTKKIGDGVVTMLLFGLVEPLMWECV